MNRELYIGKELKCIISSEEKWVNCKGEQEINVPKNGDIVKVKDVHFFMNNIYIVLEGYTDKPFNLNGFTPLHTVFVKQVIEQL